MAGFAFEGGELRVDGVSLARIAEAYGTPCYVYSRAAIEARWQAFDTAFGEHPHLVCYAVKANSNLAVIDVLARLGSGFDIVSGGELGRVRAAGGDASKVVFSGVCKGEREMQDALDAGILAFNVESEPELERLDRVAGALGTRAPVSLRVNPEVDPRTHPYIATGMRTSKFGVPIGEARRLYRRASRMAHLEVRGIDAHIGSQLSDLGAYLEAFERLLDLADELAAEGIALEHVDSGGGFGIRYRDESPPAIGDAVAAVLRTLGGRALRVLVEPGRSIVGDAGVLLTRVEYLKEGAGRRFALTDAGMNDLLRPALYGAWHEVTPVVDRADVPARDYDIAGPVCESSDVFARERSLAVRPGDLLAIHAAGAYAFAMSSNYNTRPRPAEVMVDAGAFHLVRRRETPEELWAAETTLPP